MLGESPLKEILILRTCSTSLILRTSYLILDVFKNAKGDMVKLWDILRDITLNQKTIPVSFYQLGAPAIS